MVYKHIFIGNTVQSCLSVVARKYKNYTKNDYMCLTPTSFIGNIRGIKFSMVGDCKPDKKLQQRINIMRIVPEPIDDSNQDLKGKL